MSNICSNCRRALDSDAGFCPACGSAVITTIYCPSCGAMIDTASAFCKFCAFRLDAANAAAAENPASLISPSGAAFAVICFFLPWVQASCGEKIVISTGADLGGGYWFVPFLGLVAFGAYFICRHKRILFAARWFIIAAASAALCFFIHVYYVFSKEATFKVGYFGSIIGFVLAIAGCVFISRKAVASARNKASDGDQLI